MWGKLIFAMSNATEGRLLVMLALGEAADKKGFVRQSVPTIAAWSRLTDRQVQNCIKDSISAGELELVSKGGGRGKPACYRIALKWEKRTRFWPLKGEIGQRGLARKKGEVDCTL